jgi:uncharacterized protein
MLESHYYVPNMCKFTQNKHKIGEMEIKRNIIHTLKRWKEKDQRKPLVIKGARQVGKTWVMRKFGELFFDYVAEFNFDKISELAVIFDKTGDAKRILKELELFTSVPIIPGKTLIIFDEIQESSGAFNSLKYFCEDAPEFHIVAAGSTLGISIRRKKMPVPVGKIEMVELRPVTFREFLILSDEKTYNHVENISHIEALPEIVFNRLNEEYRRYLISGGMPEAILTVLEGKGMGILEAVLGNILNLYTLDFARYADPIQTARIHNLWGSLPSQLAKENRKFLYKVVKTGARAREYEDALLWLEEAGLVHRVFCVTKPAIPLSASRDISAFKLYALDCGILRRLSGLNPEIILQGHIGFTEFKGALAENAVLQSLICQFDRVPYYWTSEHKAEVDFLLQTSTLVIPVEVKSESRVSGKSLAVYNARFNPAARIRFSANNLSQRDGLINIPVSMVDWVKRIFDIVSNQDSIQKAH